MQYNVFYYNRYTYVARKYIIYTTPSRIRCDLDEVVRSDKSTVR